MIEDFLYFCSNFSGTGQAELRERGNKKRLWRERLFTFLTLVIQRGFTRLIQISNTTLYSVT